MGGCTLRLTRDSHLRTIFIDEATGHAKYQIDTPIRITRSITRIRKFDSHTTPHHWDEDAHSDPGDHIADKRNEREGFNPEKYKGEEGDETEAELPETGDEIARIYWKWFSSDKIIFRGRITTRSEFLPKTGKMGGGYLFTGPDGVQYKWAMGVMGMNLPKLVTADEKETVIAEFHHAHYFIDKQKARLEVQAAGMDMLDYIILTFVFVENKRKERETRAKSDSG